MKNLYITVDLDYNIGWPILFLPLGITGLLTSVHKDYFRVMNHRALHFNDFGDRVAQLLHVELVAPFPYWRSSNTHREILIVNTHLLFPHDSSLCIIRLQQVIPFPRSVHVVHICSFLIFLVLVHVCKFLCFCNRFTKFCNMLSPIRRKTSLIPCPSYSAGKFLVTFSSFSVGLQYHVFLQFLQ